MARVFRATVPLTGRLLRKVTLLLRIYQLLSHGYGINTEYIPVLLLYSAETPASLRLLDGF